MSLITEELKELEKEWMDALTHDNYEAIINNLTSCFDEELFQAGYIKGLQVAILKLEEHYPSNIEDYADDLWAEDEQFYGAED